MSKALTLSLRFGLLLLAVPMPGIAAGVIGVVDTGENTVRVTLASGLEAEVGGRVYDRKGLFSEKKNPETIRWVSAIEKATTIQELIAVIPVMKLRQIAFRGVKFQFSHSVAILGNNIHIFAIGLDKRSTNLGMWKSH